MIDSNQRILIKLDEMNHYLSELQSLLPKDKKIYLQDLKIKRACEKTIELAIETVISIISVIVSANKLGLPQSEDDLIELLEKKKFLSKDLSSKVRQMKGFRNILVHKYGHVDDSQVYSYFTQDLEDFDLFEKEVKKFIKKS